jgi:hypothetical protein
LCNTYKDILEYSRQQTLNAKFTFVDGKIPSDNAILEYLKREFIDSLLKICTKLTFLKLITRNFVLEAIEGAETCPIVQDALVQMRL